MTCKHRTICQDLRDLCGASHAMLHEADTPSYTYHNAWQCRMEDVGKSKAETAARRVMERVEGCEVTAHNCRIEEKDDEFYRDFSVVILGLDSLEARRYMNQVVCSFLGVPCDAHACDERASSHDCLRCALPSPP